ncbi:MULTISPECIES: Na+/H+ antiporter subunit E [Pseudomonadaceae]|jgi:multicomponent K+:H+ antiporter subunit E|uniref:Multisubunit potassium/proton antiporter, PhaE subunit n=2 Tax=Ectopseudomonas TaxID=3236654 RepID=A4XS93_ECTM1|nr:MULTISPECIES: Na+/H+ antiporter subunit E [Pseudomonas]ARS49853.1 cation:proton antiporter [Pseudomonas mendocina]EJO93022.1 cation antiporter [Pseudomonas mendocina DLHK]MBA4245021.1 Na+/H+ antiporter subunit E [Pseudomonas sp.]MBF8163318.1 Na+/H+ antiporter subunit E [Pseudomonas mendocina]MDH0097304.1 Na+/H+ antiporter subunit E [Pseudomonas sp. GD04158]
MKRFFPHPRMMLVLAVLWLLLVNTLNLGHVLLGLFLGWAIVNLCSDFLLHVPRVRKPLGLVLFIGKVFYDIVVANLQVVRLVLGPKSRLQPAFVEVPVEIDNEFVLSALACIISLTPGTVSANISSDHRTLLLHGLDVPDRDELVATVKSRYEAPLLEIFECSRT